MGNYISASEIKQFSNLTFQELGFSSEADYDAFLDTVINQVERTIDNYCRVPSGFFRAGGLSFTETHDWSTDGEIQTRYYPIITLTKVEMDLAGYNQAADWTEISSTYYYVKSNSGIIKIVGKAPGHTENSVRITYTAGYSAVPDDVKLASLILTNNLLNTLVMSGDIRIGDVSISRREINEVFTNEVKGLLGSYRRRIARTT
jgi:hypothetical protein